MQIPIDIEDEARIIDQTDRLRFNRNTLVEPKCQKDGFTWERIDDQRIRITMEASTNLGDGLLFIELIDKLGRTIKLLVYDLKAGKFRQPVRDPEPAASASTKPQADPGRDLQIALQIGSKAALDAFLKHHPEGLHADLAKAQLEKIEGKKATK